MSQGRSIESLIHLDDRVRKKKEREDPFVEHLRSVLPRDEWEVFK